MLNKLKYGDGNGDKNSGDGDTVCLKLPSCPQNPTYNTVFNCKFKDLFEREPNQIPPLSIWVQPDLRAVSFIKRNTLTYSIPATPPCLLKRPHINYNIRRSFKDDTSPAEASSRDPPSTEIVTRWLEGRSSQQRQEAMRPVHRPQSDDRSLHRQSEEPQYRREPRRSSPRRPVVERLGTHQSSSHRHYQTAR